MLKLNPKLKKFWATRYTPQGNRIRYRVLHGGRSSSKSHDAAGIAIFLACSCKVKFMAARQFQNKIEESVYTLLKLKIEAMGLLPIFKITNNSIKCITTGSEFIFKGIARNLMEIKSTEGIDILWLEECAQLTQEQWEVLEPTIRRSGSECWLIFNPQLATDFVYKNFIVNPPEDSIVQEINYPDNPFLSDTMLRVILKAKERNPETFDHIYLGKPLNDDDRAIIKMQYLIAARDGHLKLGIDPTGSNAIGFDIADDGGDKNATIERTGTLVNGAELWDGQENELLKSAIRVFNRALQCNAQIIYDCIGVGAGVGPKFSELNSERNVDIEYIAFHAGGAPYYPDDVYLELPHQEITNREYFSNVKAQQWVLVADRLRKTYEAVELGVKHDPDELIFIDSNTPYIDQLFEELSTPRKDYDLAGRFKVESKKDLAKRGIKSPNLADAFIDCFAQVETRAPGFLDFF